jgi:acetyl esterase/lipase
LIHRLVEDGWVVLDVRYPLSPAATFPDHLIGVKKAIAWAKTTGAALGIDAGRIVIAGGSAGAHLAALAALTPNRKSLQPGFESVNVGVVGCVPFYGIFDLLNRNNTRYNWPFVAKYVMKATKEESPDLYELGSPLDLVNPDAPPFHVFHGEFDSVVLPAESWFLVAALKSEGNRVTYTEVKAAQHGFDGINGLRAKAVAATCADWLNELVSD